ncbi:MAG: NAD-dependent epimerase/dehydratase family protein [Dehalococcoidia bacterium]|nr:NAD-dependent epimerase/dehydratase family protein [Dehalococcoidia bacterium]
MSKTALVVGGTGPSGPYIVAGLIKRGFQVAIFHRGEHEVDLPSEVEHIHGDPHFVDTVEQAMGGRNFDLVVCTYGRLRLVAQVMRGRTPRFIGVGGAAYQILYRASRLPEGAPVPVPEHFPLQTDPNLDKFSSLIALSEQEVMKGHQEGGYSATYFRYPMVYGPRQLAPPEWSIMRRILDGRRAVILPDGGLKLHSRGYAENMAHALLLAVDRPEVSAGKSYNVRDQRVLSLREWVTVITGAMGHEWEYVNLPFIQARTSRPYSRGSHHVYLDISSLERDLGYEDVVPAEEAVAHTVRWYMERRPEPGGEVEKQLRDPFDYAAEDRLIEIAKEMADKVRDVPFTGFKYVHPYAHPKKPVGEA